MIVKKCFYQDVGRADNYSDIYNGIKKPPSVATFNIVQFFVSRSWSGPVGYLQLLKRFKHFLTKNVFGRRERYAIIIIIINNIKPTVVYQ